MKTVPGADGWDQLVDDGGGRDPLMHEGTGLKKTFAKDGILRDPNSITNPEFECVLQLAKGSISLTATKWTQVAKCQWKTTTALQVRVDDVRWQPVRRYLRLPNWKLQHHQRPASCNVSGWRHCSLCRDTAVGIGP